MANRLLAFLALTIALTLFLPSCNYQPVCAAYATTQEPERMNEDG